jgi:hypothetical protein
MISSVINGCKFMKFHISPHVYLKWDKIHGLLESTNTSVINTIDAGPILFYDMA